MKKVIVTVDTEGHVGSDPVRRLILGETAAGKQGGVPLLMDLFDEAGAKGLFFVDFAEAHDYGREKIAQVVRLILDRGHDVGVHIHPDHMTESKNKFLFDYSDGEQEDIIRRCTDLYTEICGKPPAAFRAGKYGANRKTLEILAKLNYQADFSQYCGYTKWCHIAPPVTGNESVRLDSGLLEFPVMAYHHVFPGLFNRVDKLDINSGRSHHSEIFSRLLAEKDVNVIVMFVHSFSLLNWRQTPDNPTINPKTVANLRFALERVNKEENAAFTDLNGLLAGTYRSSAEAEKDVFRFSGLPALRFYAEKTADVLKTKYQIRRYAKTR